MAPRAETPELPVAPLDVLRQRRSAKWRTYPSDVLPLTVAEMDYDLAPSIRGVLYEAVERSDTGYGFPVPDLGVALAGFAGARWGWQVDPNQVTAVTDVGVGIVELVRVIARAGDAIVISPPVYPPFFDWVPEARARTLEVPLHQDDGRWRLDLPALERAFATHPAAYLLCNPHNPVGTVHSPDELEALVRLAHAYRVVIVSDEIHAPLVLPGATFTPILTVPGAGDVAISVTSASKAWNLAGLKCAAVVTSSPGMAAITARFPPDARWRVGHLGVLATVAAYTDGTDWLDTLLHTLDLRRTQLTELIQAHLPGVSWTPPQGTYLAWLDCTAVGGDQARARFLDQGRIALEPGTRFGAAGSGHVRLNFATSPAILATAVEGMAGSAGSR